MRGAREPVQLPWPGKGWGLAVNVGLLVAETGNIPRIAVASYFRQVLPFPTTPLLPPLYQSSGCCLASSESALKACVESSRKMHARSGILGRIKCAKSSMFTGLGTVGRINLGGVEGIGTKD